MFKIVTGQPNQLYMQKQLLLYIKSVNVIDEGFCWKCRCVGKKQKRKCFLLAPHPMT